MSILLILLTVLAVTWRWECSPLHKTPTTLFSAEDQLVIMVVGHNNS